ncbi:MAG: hypothetical protein ACE5HO_07265 [bacterium]
MKANKTKKKFDAVAMMREIRDKLSERYLENPASEDEDLAQIREKYSIRIKERV